MQRLLIVLVITVGVVVGSCIQSRSAARSAAPVVASVVLQRGAAVSVAPAHYDIPRAECDFRVSCCPSLFNTQ